MIKLVRTCWACPEQYDAFDEEGKQVGYLRLRHGNFTVDCPDALETEVYRAYPKGDGIFDNDEREYYLKWAVFHIQKWIDDGKPERKYTNELPPAPDVKYILEDEYSELDY